MYTPTGVSNRPMNVSFELWYPQIVGYVAFVADVLFVRLIRRAHWCAVRMRSIIKRRRHPKEGGTLCRERASYNRTTSAMPVVKVVLLWHHAILFVGSCDTIGLYVWRPQVLKDKTTFCFGVLVNQQTQQDTRKNKNEKCSVFMLCIASSSPPRDCFLNPTAHPVISTPPESTSPEDIWYSSTRKTFLYHL